MSGANFTDWLEICNLKARYCRCLDTKDWQGYRAVYTDDAILDTGPSGGLRMGGAWRIAESILTRINMEMSA